MLLTVGARLRGPPGGGHLLLGLRQHPWLAVVIIVIVVAVAVYLDRRRR